MASDTVTLNRLLEMLARESGFYFEGTASGTHSATTLEDDSADGFDPIDDNRLVGKWLRIVSADSAAPEGEVRKVSSVSTTTLTVDTAFSAAPADGDTYELLPFHPNDLIDAIQQAIRQAHPVLWVPLRDETLQVDNLLSNWDFETFSGGFTGWTEAGSPTVTQDTTRVFQGSNAAKVVAAGSAGQLTQDLYLTIESLDAAGRELYAFAHAWADTADVARIRVTFDGSDYESSSYHAGGAEWEGAQTLFVSVTIPTDANEATIVLETAANGTAFFDYAGASVGTIERYTIPTDFFGSPTRVLQMAAWDKPNGLYVPVTDYSPARAHRILRLEGRGPLSVPTTGTGTTEVSERQAEYLLARAAAVLYRRLASTDRQNRDDHRERAAEWERETAIRERQYKMTAVADFPKGGWSTVEDTDGEYLVLVR